MPGLRAEDLPGVPKSAKTQGKVANTIEKQNQEKRKGQACNRFVEWENKAAHIHPCCRTKSIISSSGSKLKYSSKEAPLVPQLARAVALGYDYILIFLIAK